MWILKESGTHEEFPCEHFVWEAAGEVCGLLSLQPSVWEEEGGQWFCMTQFPSLTVPLG